MSASYDPRRGRWIPWVFVGAMLTVVVVNGVLVWFALSTFTGVTVPRAYERGRGYDQVLAAAARQDALGWTGTVSFEAGRLVVTLRDRHGEAVPARLEGRLLRPLEGTTLALDFVALGPGLWQAFPQLPKPGQWEAQLTLHGTDGAVFELRKRLLLP